MTRLAYYVSDDDRLDRLIFDMKTCRKPRSYSSPDKHIDLETPKVENRFSDCPSSDASTSSGSSTGELTSTFSKGAPMCAFCTKMPAAESSQRKSSQRYRLDEDIYFFKRKSLPVNSERKVWVKLHRKLSSISLSSLSRKRLSGDWCSGPKSPGGSHIENSPTATCGASPVTGRRHPSDVSAISDVSMGSFLLSRSVFYRKSASNDDGDLSHLSFGRYRSYSSVEIPRKQYGGTTTPSRLRSVSFTDRVDPLTDVSYSPVEIPRKQYSGTTTPARLRSVSFTDRVEPLTDVSYSSVEIPRKQYSGTTTPTRLRSVSFTNKVKPLTDRPYSPVEIPRKRYSEPTTPTHSRSISFADKVKPVADLSIAVSSRDYQETNLCTTDL